MSARLEHEERKLEELEQRVATQRRIVACIKASLDNPGLLPDELEAAVACGECDECIDGLDCSRWRP